MTTAQHDSDKEIRVWNLPVRLFHWALVGSFLTAWLTLDDRYLDIHVFAGYLMAGLLLFRLAWGWLGGPHARFADFSYGARAALAYVRDVLAGRARRFLGHNPAGSWAIYLLLGLGLLSVLTGLLTLGGEEQHGPLAGWLGFAAGSVFHGIHEWLAWLMLAVVVIHVLGVLVESHLHGENLVMAMITGRKRASPGQQEATAARPVAVLMLLIMLLGAFGWFRGYLDGTPEHPYLPFTGPQLADDALWREECGSCHLAFHPSLLPARSWQRMMREQADHFGEDLYLEADTVKALSRFLLANAAESHPTEAAWKIDRSIPADRQPLRITATPYWKDKHQDIDTRIWKQSTVQGRSNCAACHHDAEQGTFEDAAMRIPDATGKATTMSSAGMDLSVN